MKKILYFKYLILAQILMSCNSKGKTLKESRLLNSEITKTNDQSNRSDTSKSIKYCTIKKLFNKKGTSFVTVNYIDYLTGDKALEKAKLNGDADYEINKDGDTIHFLNTDHYISNHNTKSITLELISDIKIELWNYPENNSLFNKVSIQELDSYLSNNPLMILKIKNGIVIEMKEKYLP